MVSTFRSRSGAWLDAKTRTHQTHRRKAGFEVKPADESGSDLGRRFVFPEPLERSFGGRWNATTSSSRTWPF